MSVFAYLMKIHLIIHLPEVTAPPAGDPEHGWVLPQETYIGLEINRLINTKQNFIIISNSQFFSSQFEALLSASE